MGRNRFQNPDVTRLSLSENDWIEVRTRLSGVEKRKMLAAAFSTVQNEAGGDPLNPKIGVDFSMLAIARMKTYLRDWSFRDATDKPVKCTPDAVDALDEETFAEIDAVLDEHAEALDLQKKVQAGGTPPSKDS